MPKYETIADKQKNPWDVHRQDIIVQEETLRNDYGTTDFDARLEDALNRAGKSKRISIKGKDLEL